MMPRRRKEAAPSRGAASARQKVHSPTLPCRLVKCCLPFRFCGRVGVRARQVGTPGQRAAARQALPHTSASHAAYRAPHLVVIDGIEAHGNARGGGALDDGVVGDGLRSQAATCSTEGQLSCSMRRLRPVALHTCHHGPRAPTCTRVRPSFGRNLTAAMIPSVMKLQGQLKECRHFLC